MKTIVRHRPATDEETELLEAACVTYRDLFVFLAGKDRDPAEMSMHAYALVQVGAEILAQVTQGDPEARGILIEAVQEYFGRVCVSVGERLDVRIDRRKHAKG